MDRVEEEDGAAGALTADIISLKWCFVVVLVLVLVWQATLAELRSMLQLVEADTRQVYISVVNPLLSARLAGMLEHGDFTVQVGYCLFFRPSFPVWLMLIVSLLSESFDLLVLH